MGKHYDFSKPPKFVVNFFSFFRKWKLSRYKKKKIRQDKSFRNRTYHVRFKIKVDDPINPQESSKVYDMVVPAKASFFAKRKAEKSIRQKLRFEFFDCELMTDEEFEELESTKEQYLEDVKEGRVVKD